MEALYLLGRHFEKDILKHFRHVLMASFFSCVDQPYGYSCGLATRYSAEQIVNSAFAVFQRVNAGEFHAVTT
jgi:hypothetical protein